MPPPSTARVIRCTNIPFGEDYWKGYLLEGLQLPSHCYSPDAMPEDLARRVQQLELRLERATVRARRQRLGYAIGVAAMVATPVVGYAITIPTGDIEDAEPISAEAMVERFELIQSVVTDLEASTLRSRGTYCASTATQDGNMGGYSGADAQCVALEDCDDPTAHVCTAPELVTLASEETVLSGRYATGVWGERESGPDLADCRGFASNDANEWGNIWSDTQPAGAQCDIELALLCCHAPPPP